MLLSLLSSLDMTSARGSKRLTRSSTNLGTKIVPLYCSKRGRFSLTVCASSDMAILIQKKTAREVLVIAQLVG